MGPLKFCEANPEGALQPEFQGALAGAGAVTRLLAVARCCRSPLGEPAAGLLGGGRVFFALLYECVEVYLVAYSALFFVGLAQSCPVLSGY